MRKPTKRTVKSKRQPRTKSETTNASQGRMPQHRFTSLAKSADVRLQKLDQRFSDQRENFVSRSANRLLDAWLALPSEIRDRFNELLDRERGR